MLFIDNTYIYQCNEIENGSVNHRMKQRLFILFFLALAMGCTKNSPEASLLGTWELRSQIGGFVGTILYAPGNGNTFRFIDGNIYTSVYQSSLGTVSRSGTWQLHPANSQGDLILTLTYQNNNRVVNERDSIRLQNDQLIFLPIASCCDNPTTVYQKQ